MSNGLKWKGNHTKTFSSFLDIHGINVEYARKIKETVKISRVAVIGGMQAALTAAETYAYYRNALLEGMDRRGIQQYLNAKCLSFDGDGVTIEQNGNVIKLDADTCIYSMGMKVDAKALEQLRAMAGDIPVKLIGDCDKVGKLGDAVRGGYMAAMYVGVEE